MKKSSKGKIIAYCCIALAFLFLFFVYVLFFSGNQKFNSFPFILGTLTMFVVYMVRSHGTKPIEIDLVKKDHDKPDNDSISCSD